MIRSPHSSDDPSLQYLLDRAAIEEVIGGFGLVQDVKEFALVIDFLSEDVVFDYTSVFGGEPLQGRRVIQQWILSRIPGYDASQHMVSNLQIAIEAGFARARSHVRSTLRIGERICNIGGHYLHELRKDGDGRWRISLLKFTMLYSEGDTTVPAATIPRAPAWLAEHPIGTGPDRWP